MLIFCIALCIAIVMIGFGIVFSIVDEYKEWKEPGSTDFMNEYPPMPDDY